MNHYCTYFDSGFLIQGLALHRSLVRYDPDAVLWVLALDHAAGDTLRQLGEASLRVVPLSALEDTDLKLASVKSSRTRIEYYFTLSPYWPRWLLAKRSDIARITYIDADMFFFASPQPVLAAMDSAEASVLITAHRFLPWQRHYERHGKFNVGILSFRNDSAGRGCLDEWRSQCLSWCYDRLENGRYADQKYLDEWPAQLGQKLLILDHPGVNLAPWNWRRHTFTICQRGFVAVGGADPRGCDPGIYVDDQPLILFHFARFRPRYGTWCWQSGQLDYGVMPRRIRNGIYIPYVDALLAARKEIAALRPGFGFSRQPARLDRNFWRAMPLRVLFGGDWVRIGGQFLNFRGGLGRWSGQVLAKLRTIFLRT